MLLLNSNERASSLSESVLSAIVQSTRLGEIQRYPDYQVLQRELANYVGVLSNQILLTNGSDQAIDLIFRGLTQADSKVIIPKPSFSMFFYCAENAKCDVISPSYDPFTGDYPLAEVMDQINDTIQLVVICNPNNPTGTLVTCDAIETVAKKLSQGFVLVDEAYFEFSQITAVDLLSKYPNILITRTFSKAFGLAGLRIGYVIGSVSVVDKLNGWKGVHDVNAIASKAAIAALKDSQSMTRYVSEVMELSRPKIERFFEENNISFYPSKGNFILFKPHDVDFIYQSLFEENILVRKFSEAELKDYLRVTISTVEEMDQFIAVYRRFVPKKYAFFDRDGTLIEEPQGTFQIDSLDKLKILEGVISGLKKLQAWGYRLILVSNQDGLGTAVFPRKKFEAVQEVFLETMCSQGIVFDKIFICPHFSKDNCQCRKPKIGLVSNFMEENKNKIDLRYSFVCGDRETDKKFADNLGLTFFSIKTNSSLVNLVNDIGEWVV